MISTGQHWHVVKWMEEISDTTPWGQTEVAEVATYDWKHLKNTKKAKEKQRKEEGEIKKGEKGRGEGAGSQIHILVSLIQTN